MSCLMEKNLDSYNFAEVEKILADYLQSKNKNYDIDSENIFFKNIKKLLNV